jgi:universal stress protein E
MSKKIERILIAVKPWENSLPISYERALQLAQGLKAEIALTSAIRLSAEAIEFDWLTGISPADFDPASFDRSDDELALLDRLAQPLRAAGAAVTTRVRTEASPERGILDEVDDWEAGLLIAGVHEQRIVPHPRLLDVDWQLMRRCPCPLLLAQQHTAEPYRSILAAVDPLHDHAEPEGLDHAILGAARQFRDVFEAKLQILNVYPDPGEFELASSVEVRPGVFYSSDNIEAVHRQAVIDLANDCGVADADLQWLPGEPSDRIAEMARQAKSDLVVLGSIKRSRMHELFLGSTAEFVVDAVSSDVLLLKPPARR